MVYNAIFCSLDYNPYYLNLIMFEWHSIGKVTSKHIKGGKESRMDVLVMENLLYRRTVTRLYDLKGSSRSRYNADITGKNKVLLDQNLIEAMPTSPIFVGNKAKRSLERAVWNDTGFLAVSLNFLFVMIFFLLLTGFLSKWASHAFVFLLCSLLM